MSDVYIITELGNKLYFCVETGELHVSIVQDNHFPVSILIKLRELLRGDCRLKMMDYTCSSQKEAISELEKDASYKEQKALMFEQAEKEFKKTLSKEIIEEVGYYNALVNNIKENDAGRKWMA